MATATRKKKPGSKPRTRRTKGAASSANGQKFLDDDMKPEEHPELNALCDEYQAHKEKRKEAKEWEKAAFESLGEKMDELDLTYYARKGVAYELTRDKKLHVRKQKTAGED